MRFLKFLTLLGVITAEPDVATKAPLAFNRGSDSETPPILNPLENETPSTNVPEGSAMPNGVLFQQVEQTPALTVINGESPSKQNAGFWGRIITEARDSFRGLSLITDDKEPDTTETTVSVSQTPNLLPDPNAEVYVKAERILIYNDLYRWTTDGSPYSPEQTADLKEIARVLDIVWRTSLPIDEVMVLTTRDFHSIVAVIRNLRKKVGLAELATATLLAIVVNRQLYGNIGCRSESEFFQRHSEAMGLSSSRVRDYCKRGRAFLKYKGDILNGVGNTSGITLDEFVGHHMSKLTLYEKAVEKFGAEEALRNLKELSFREFQKAISTRKPKNEISPNDLSKTPPSKNSSSHEILEDQKAMFLKLDFAPNEKRLLRIIAKGGIFCITNERLTEDQVTLVETRLRQRRVQVFENNLKCGPLAVPYKPFDPNNPLVISDELYTLSNINDIILRIRAGLALVVPARRTIAILVFRLYSEKLEFESQWKHPRDGIEYKSFRDFAMEELGLGEDYRDYIAVGRVLKDYYYFLDGLSDMDTEVVFLKLRYLPPALRNHKGDEPLVLARLRTLTVREFKLFSEDPDFEITFSKRFTKKQLDRLNEMLPTTRNSLGINTSVDFIEAYHKTEFGFIRNIVSEVIEETQSKTSEAAGHPNEVNDLNPSVNGSHSISVA
jgi:hypothetical protein